jgi:hypothetical protein
MLKEGDDLQSLRLKYWISRFAVNGVRKARGTEKSESWHTDHNTEHYRPRYNEM